MTVLLAVATGILVNTPLWVWGLLLLLVWLGSLSLKRRRMPLRRVAIVPAVFIVWGLSGLIGRPFEAATIAALWLAGLAAALPVGVATGPRILGADRAGRSVELPPSWWPLLRNLIFFFAHYALNVAAAILPAHKPTLQQAGIVVSGAGAGYFIGWMAGLLRRWRVVPAVPVTASAA